MNGRTAILTSLVLTLACGDDDDATTATDASVDAAPAVDAGPYWEPLDRPPLPAGNAPDASDEERYQGMLRFLWDPWDTEALDQWPPAEFMLQLLEDEPEVFGEQFSEFGFIPDPNDDLPIGLKRGLMDDTRIHETCAMCHVARLPSGELWLGLPATELDIGAFRVAINERWVAAGNDPLMTDLQIAKAQQLGPGRQNAESSSYEQVVPADFPPYFGLGDRDAMNYLGTGADARTEGYFAIFAFGAGDPNDAEALVPFPPTSRTGPMVAFLESIAPPPPTPQEPGTVAMGEAIFERERCNECHHVDEPGEIGIVTYDYEGVERFPGDDPEFPNGSIATSRWHRVLIDGDESGGGAVGDEGRANLIQFIIRNRLAVRMSDGYRALDLRGVWATAPYLHNGSVPTLEALFLPPAERPASFERSGFTIDTSVAGNGNGGHDFGTGLSEDERSALIAYLRTL